MKSTLYFRHGFAVPVIPVVSFNGQKYAVNVIKAELLSMFIEEDPASADESDAITFTIKNVVYLKCPLRHVGAGSSLHSRFH